MNELIEFYVIKFHNILSTQSTCLPVVTPLVEVLLRASLLELGVVEPAALAVTERVLLGLASVRERPTLKKERDCDQQQM